MKTNTKKRGSPPTEKETSYDKSKKQGKKVGWVDG